MTLRRKIWIGVVALMVAAIGILGTIRYRESRTQRTTEAQIAADFQQLRHDLPPGTPRSAVVDYLNRHNLIYSEDGSAFTADLGKTPGDRVACADWNWFAKFSFEGVGPGSRLENIELSSSGRCL